MRTWYHSTARMRMGSSGCIIALYSTLGQLRGALSDPHGVTNGPHNEFVSLLVHAVTAVPPTDACTSPIGTLPFRLSYRCRPVQ